MPTSQPAAFFWNSSMRSKLSPSPPLLALLLGVALLVWLMFGDMQHFQDAPATGDLASQDTALPRVEVSVSQAQAHMPRLLVQGQLEPRYEVELRARQAGKVVALPKPLGARVSAEETLIELDSEDLPEQLARAEAELELQRAELSAGQRLRDRELLSGNELLRLKSELAQATAELASLRQTLDDTRLAAPFAGILDRLDIELGDYVQPGETLARLVDIDALTATGWLPQRRVASVAVGQPVELTLLDGRRLEGEVSYVASRADESTRSFALEVDVANPERLRIAGASATLKIALEPHAAHRLSPARLILDDRGRLGIKHVDERDIVRFTPVTLLSVDAEHAWVSGLPERINVITLGGGFVNVGEHVAAVPAADVER